MGVQCGVVDTVDPLHRSVCHCTSIWVCMQNECHFAKGHQNSSLKGTVSLTINQLPKRCVHAKSNNAFPWISDSAHISVFNIGAPVDRFYHNGWANSHWNPLSLFACTHLLREQFWHCLVLLSVVKKENKPWQVVQQTFCKQVLFLQCTIQAEQCYVKTVPMVGDTVTYFMATRGVVSGQILIALALTRKTKKNHENRTIISEMAAISVL